MGQNFVLDEEIMRVRLLRFLDKCRWCRDLYDALTPWVQIGAFIILCGFTAGTAWAQFKAQQASIDEIALVVKSNTSRLGILENQFGRIDQKLDDIKEYMGRRR